jgi:secreted PhoX family phosphatase
MDRREFLTRTLAVGAIAIGDALLPRAIANAATTPEVAPYGPLMAPDANGLMLPKGFRSRVIATTGQPVGKNDFVWHSAPDGGACFPAPRGGWVYVSNSEVDPNGGVGAIRFSAEGDIVDAYPILHNTRRNCAGGTTPWNTWLSCEEVSDGHVWECNPLGKGQGFRRPLLGTFNHEATVVDPRTGHLYLTEDDPVGRLYRFVPTRRGRLDRGSLFAARLDGDAVTWIPTETDRPDRNEATTAFNGGEGLWVQGDTMYITTKGDVRVWRMNLQRQRLGAIYHWADTPDAPLNAVDNVTLHVPSSDVFVAEDGGNMELVVFSRAGQNVSVAPFLRFAGHDLSEVTGPAFSPDGRRLYLSSQRGTDNKTGVTVEVSGPFRRLQQNARLFP